MALMKAVFAGPSIPSTFSARAQRLISCRLVKMPMDSVCEENVEKLMNEKGDKEKELEYYQKITAEQLWFDELENLKL